jgi:hypothetical protein
MLIIIILNIRPKLNLECFSEFSAPAPAPAAPAPAPAPKPKKSKIKVRVKFGPNTPLKRVEKVVQVIKKAIAG